jgi:cytochrome c553
MAPWVVVAPLFGREAGRDYTPGPRGGNSALLRLTCRALSFTKSPEPMDRRSKPLIAFGILAFASFAALADGDPARGEKLSYACMGCHGIEHYKNAYPAYRVPKLGGQNAAYIVAALAEYQSGTRPHPTMRGFASSLTAEDRADLAAYFSSRVPPSAGPEPVGAAPPQAEPCAACHGKNGRGTTPDYPNIGGQHADYIAHALNAYRLGKRNHPIMSAFAKNLTEDDIEALAEYFSGQTGLETPRRDD